MLSHFYLQRSEARTIRHKSSALEYLAEKNIPAKLMPKYQEIGVNELSTGDVENAFASSSMMAKVLSEKRRRMRKAKQGKTDD